RRTRPGTVVPRPGSLPGSRTGSARAGDVPGGVVALAGRGRGRVSQLGLLNRPRAGGSGGERRRRCESDATGAPGGAEVGGLGIPAEDGEERPRGGGMQVTRGDVLRALDIEPDAFVVEVGGGHRPFGRADLVLEKYPFEEAHRSFGMVHRAPVVIADAMRLPIPERGCDVIFASHLV